MWRDVGTIIWKERRVRQMQHGGWRGLLIASMFPAMILCVFAITLPLVVGKPWIRSVFPYLLSLLVPLMLCTTTAADSIAGERERRTLETLLVSRLPSSTILLGKMAYALGLGLGVTLFLHLLSLLAFNLFFSQGIFALYAMPIVCRNAALAILSGVLAVSLAALVSAQSGTVHLATRNVMFVIFLFLCFLPLVNAGMGVIFPQHWQLGSGAVTLETISWVYWDQALLFFSTVFFLVDGLFIGVAFWRFGGERMLLH